MKIILTSPIHKVGNIGDVVEVKNGYARNFLIPKNLARKFSEEEMVLFNERKQELEKVNEQKISHAEKILNKLKDLEIKVPKRASMEGNLYGSVSNKEVVDALKSEDVEIESRQVIMHDRIKSIGEYKIKLDLHAGIIAEINLQVVASSS